MFGGRELGFQVKPSKWEYGCYSKFKSLFFHWWVSTDFVILLFQIQTETPLQMKLSLIVVNRSYKRVTFNWFSKLPFCLLFLFFDNQSEIILMPKRHILEWRSLLIFSISSRGIAMKTTNKVSIYVEIPPTCQQNDYIKRDMKIGLMCTPNLKAHGRYC